MSEIEKCDGGTLRFVEVAGGRLPYEWMSGGWVGMQEIPPC
jgi:hypothetical protein